MGCAEAGHQRCVYGPRPACRAAQSSPRAFSNRARASPRSTTGSG